MTHPRYFLFGLIRVPMYEYYWGYTAAQIELASIDAPYVAYKAKEKKSGIDPDYNREKANRDYKKWEERRKKRKFKLDDFLNTNKADNVGETKEKDA